MANKHFIKKNCILFDFDGVIADTLDLKASIFREIYKKMECNSLQLKYVEKFHLANGGISRNNKFKHFHKKFFNVNISYYQINKLSKLFSQIFKKNIKKIKIVKGFISAIKKIKKNKFKIFIISSATKNDIRLILKKNNVSLFDDILDNKKSKIKHLENIKKKYSINYNEMLFIGDSNEDYSVSKLKKISFILRRHKYNLELYKIKNYIYDFQNFEINLK